MLLPVKVSVIVPVYNAGKYIAQCIGSITRQTLMELEIIIINDGSSDNSLEIMNVLAKKDDRIIVIDKLNAGVSIARNEGIKIANGEYLGFVDADDWLQPTFFETLYEAVTTQQADWAICNINVVEGEREVSQRLQLKDEYVNIETCREEVLENFLEFDYDYSNWNKLYKTTIIREQAIFFKEKMVIWEDLLFNLYFLPFSGSMVTINQPLYNYRVHAGSVMNSSEKLFSVDYNMLYESVVSFYKKNELPGLIRIFRLNRLQTWKGNFIRFIQLKEKGMSFWSFFRNLKKETSVLDRDIYLYKNALPAKNSIGQFLLKKRLYGWFSFLTTSKVFAGKIIHKK